MLLVLAVGVVFVAAIVQKITGLGFALVGSPLLALLYGPTTGILIIILNGLIISSFMVVTSLKLINWRSTLLLISEGILAAPLGAWVTGALAPPWLLVLVGGAALLSLLAPYIKLGGSKMVGTQAGPASGLFAGAVAGFLHVTSGLSGPPLVAFGAKTKWDHISFVASIQMFFITFSGFALLTRGFPQLPITEMLALSGTVILGLIAGTLLLRIVPVHIARAGMFTVAWIGAVTVLLRGILSLL